MKSITDFFVNIKQLKNKIADVLTQSKAYTDTAEQNAKDYTDSAVSAITDNIKNLTIVKTTNISDIDASNINISDTPRIMFYYTGATSQFYISFDYYWIRLQIRSNSRYIEARTIYGATVGTWSRI